MWTSGWTWRTPTKRWSNTSIHNVDRSQAQQRDSFRRAHAILERLARENPTVAGVRFSWAELLCDNGISFWDPKARLPYMKLGVQLYRELLASDPGVPRVAGGLGQALGMYGFALWQSGERSEGMRLLRESLDLFENQDFSESSYGDARGAYARLASASQFAVALAFSGRAAEGLEVVGRSLAVGERIIARHEGRPVRVIFAQNLALHSYLAFGAGRAADAARSIERAAAVLEPIDLNPGATWLMGAIHMMWYLQGRSAAPGRPAEPPGRPEHATRSIALVRQAAERGYVDVNLTAAFFGPVLGHLPEFQRLMMDLAFPNDPFVPEPDAELDDPSVPSAGATP